MTIRFEFCPYHEPSAVGYERTMVVDDFTRQFKCAICDASGSIGPADQFPSIPIYPRGKLARKNSDGDYGTDFGVIDAGYAKHPLSKESSNA